MKLTTPSDKSKGISKLDIALTLFEQQLKENDDSNYYHLVIVGEFNRAICDEVEKQYTLVGWKDVKCRTSSENGERGGLTGLILKK